MTGLRNILRRLGLAGAGHNTPLAPDGPFVAIGDIHGRDDLLRKMDLLLAKEAPDLPRVFLGDYIDRGRGSAAVLQNLMALEQAGSPPTICLMGNHEAMMLEAVDSPETGMSRWLANGGTATLKSFGIDSTDAAPQKLANTLREIAGDALLSWVSQRPIYWKSGNVVASHAGGDPAKPIEPRRGHGLIWGHPDLFAKSRHDGLWMVHGHYIRPKPEISNGRIGIDTGAFATGVLTAAIIAPEGVRFLSVESETGEPAK